MSFIPVVPPYKIIFQTTCLPLGVKVSVPDLASGRVIAYSFVVVFPDASFAGNTYCEDEYVVPPSSPI